VKDNDHWLGQPIAPRNGLTQTRGYSDPPGGQAAAIPSLPAGQGRSMGPDVLPTAVGGV